MLQQFVDGEDFVIQIEHLVVEEFFEVWEQLGVFEHIDKLHIPWVFFALRFDARQGLMGRQLLGDGHEFKVFFVVVLKLLDMQAAV